MPRPRQTPRRAPPRYPNLVEDIVGGISFVTIVYVGIWLAWGLL